MAINCVLCEVGTEVLCEIRVTVVFKVLREMSLLALLSWYKEKLFRKAASFWQEPVDVHTAWRSIDCGSVNIGMQRK